MKRKDTDYLSLSAQVRAMENTLLTRERLERVITARSIDEAVKAVQELGYPSLTSAAPQEIDRVIAAARAELYRAPEFSQERLAEVFQCEYDYHNLKALLKGRFLGVDVSDLLVDWGRERVETLRLAVREEDWDLLGEDLADAGRAAERVLQQSRDGQQMELILDQACYAQQLQIARGSDFLLGFVRCRIDRANLRVLVRAERMKLPEETLRRALIPGGTVTREEILAVRAGEESLSALYGATVFAAAAEQAERGGTVTEFERLCDDGVTEYLEGAQFVPFGEQAVIAYLAARETEFMNLRIALLGRSMGLPADVIRQRLRA